MSMVFAGFMGAAREDRLKKEALEAEREENQKDREWELKKYNLTKVEEQRLKDAELKSQVDALIESHPDRLQPGHRAFLTRQLEAGFTVSDLSQGILDGSLRLTGPSSGGSGGGGGVTPSSGTTSAANIPEERRVAWRNGIAAIESDGSGGYQAIGATHPKYGRALGRYQIMEANLPQWSQAALGRVVSPEEFLESEKIQDAIFDHRFGMYVEKYGEENAARAWFGGEAGIDNPERTDVHGRLNVGSYGATFMENIGGPERVYNASAGGSDNLEAANPAATPASATEEPAADDETEQAFGGAWVPKPNEDQLKFDNDVVNRLASAGSMDEANRQLVGNYEQLSPDGQRRADALMAAREAELDDPTIYDRPEDLAALPTATLGGMYDLLTAQGETEKAERVKVAIEGRQRYENTETATTEDPKNLIGGSLQEKKDWWIAVGQNLPEDDPRREVGKAMLDAQEAAENGEDALTIEEMYGKPLDQLAAIEQDLRRNGKVEEAERIKGIRTDREAYLNENSEKAYRDISTISTSNYIGRAAAAREAGEEDLAKEIERIGKEYEKAGVKATDQKARIEYIDNDGTLRRALGVQMDDGTVLVNGRRVEEFINLTPYEELDAAMSEMVRMQTTHIVPVQDARVAAGDLLDSAESLSQIVQANPEVLTTAGGFLSSILERGGVEANALFERLQGGESVESVADDVVSSFGGNTESAAAYHRYVAESLRLGYVYASSGLDQSGQGLSNQDFNKALRIIAAGSKPGPFNENLRGLMSGVMTKLDALTVEKSGSPGMELFRSRFGDHPEIMDDISRVDLTARDYMLDVGLADELAWLEGETTEARAGDDSYNDVIDGGAATDTIPQEVTLEMIEAGANGLLADEAEYNRIKSNLAKITPEDREEYLRLEAKQTFPEIFAIDPDDAIGLLAETVK